MTASVAAIAEIYEVKTSCARFDIYAAIGQLLVHGAAEGCKRTIVIPEKELIATDLTKALRRIGVELLRYRLDQTKATILAG